MNLIYSMILALETSSNICGISLVERNNILNIIDEPCHREHNERLPVLIESMFKNCNVSLDDIEAIAVNIGPGSFTGLRIGLGFAKGIAYSKNLPIIPVPSLLALAFSLKEYLPKNGILLSHANKVFYQEFEWANNLPKIVSRPMIGLIDEFVKQLDNGFQSNSTKIIKNNLKSREAYPSASSVGLLASLFFDEWIIRKPYNLVPDYIDAFKIKNHA